MRPSAKFAIVAGVLLAACSDTFGVLPTDFGRQMADFNAATPELVLREAVFLKVKGKDDWEAAKTLEDDGSVCSGSVCSCSLIHHETRSDTWGVRLPGSRRNTKRIWIVTFFNDQILN